MSGDTDRLAQIEDQVQSEITLRVSSGLYQTVDVLALVEIAKAARWFAAEGNRTTANDPAWQRLRAALSALDGDT